MRSYRGSNVGLNFTSVEVFRKIFDYFSTKVFADEIENPSDGEGNQNTNVEKSTDNDYGGSPTPSINYEDLISKARSEEKAKQYNKIKKLTEENKSLTEKQNELLLKIGQLESDLDEANKKLTTAGKGDTEQVKTLKADLEKVNKDLEAALAELKVFKDTPPVNEEEVEKRVREEVEKEFEVKLYRTEKIAAHADDPTFIAEMVVGDTKEAIDTSYEQTLNRSNEIKKSLGLTQSGNPDGRKGNGRTPKSPNNPAAQFGGVNSIEQLATLDPRTNPSEYKELRKQLGLE